MSGAFTLLADIVATLIMASFGLLALSVVALFIFDALDQKIIQDIKKEFKQ